MSRLLTNNRCQDKNNDFAGKKTVILKTVVIEAAAHSKVTGFIKRQSPPGGPGGAIVGRFAGTAAENTGRLAGL
jgi:hypothetical protein